MELPAEIEDFNIGDLVSIGVNIMGFGTGIDGKQFQLIRGQAHFLKQFPFCAVLDFFVDFDGTTGVPPTVIVGPLSEKQTAFAVNAQNACRALNQGSVSQYVS